MVKCPKRFLNYDKEKNFSDRRFKQSAWKNNPYFNMIKQQYLTSSKIIEETVKSIDGLSQSDAKQISFFTKQMIDFFLQQIF